MTRLRDRALEQLGRPPAFQVGLPDPAFGLRGAALPAFQLGLRDAALQLGRRGPTSINRGPTNGLGAWGERAEAGEVYFVDPRGHVSAFIHPMRGLS